MSLTVATHCIGCDMPCDLNCDLPHFKSCSICDFFSSCDCGSCDWSSRKSKSREQEQYVYIPPKSAGRKEA